MSPAGATARDFIVWPTPFRMRHYSCVKCYTKAGFFMLVELPHVSKLFVSNTCPQEPSYCVFLSITEFWMNLQKAKFSLLLGWWIGEYESASFCRVREGVYRLYKRIIWLYNHSRFPILFTISSDVIASARNARFFAQSAISVR